jgi:hypothetical protein
MKSAVEWLVGEISKDRVGQAIIKTFLKEFEQAKEMEKQQIINPLIALGWTIEKAEQYYNKIFKNKL